MRLTLDKKLFIQEVFTGNVDNSQNHQYECIPEYLLKMTIRHHHPPIVCHHQHQMQYQSSTCSVSYATFSRSILLSRVATTTITSDRNESTCSPSLLVTVVLEESSTPLLASSFLLRISSNMRQDIHVFTKIKYDSM
ncbi:unnamed protein product, partial [Rotaria socialis]